MFNIILITLRNQGGSQGLDLGVAYIAGALEKKGVCFSVVDSNDYAFTLDTVYPLLAKSPKQGLVLLGGMLGNRNYSLLKSFCQEIKRTYSDVLIFMGGPLATFCSDIVIKNFIIDGIIIGDGQETVIELINALENQENLDNVSGIAYRQGETVLFTPPRPYRGKLTLPVPKFSKFDMDAYLAYYHSSGRAWNIIGSKGCYSQCRYCTRSDKVLRFRQPQEIITEIQHLYTQYGITRFNFVDDNFLTSKRFIREIIGQFKYLDFPIAFRFQGRVDRIDEDTLVALKEVGLSGISFGIESGSQTILNEMQKKSTVEQGDYALALCRKHKIPYHASFILGMPSETDQTVEETFQFLKRNHFTTNYRICYLTLFPGTPLYTDVIQQKLITDEDAYCASLDHVYDEIITNLTHYPDTQLRQWKKKLESLRNGS